MALLPERPKDVVVVDPLGFEHRPEVTYLGVEDGVNTFQAVVQPEWRQGVIPRFWVRNVRIGVLPPNTAVVLSFACDEERWPEQG